MSEHINDNEALDASRKVVEPVRAATDERLHTERDDTDRELARHLARPEEEYARLLEATRRRTDAALSAMAEDAAEEARSHPAAEPVQRAVEELSERTEEVVERERGHADRVTELERLQKARAFREILSAERRDTDRALERERASTDRLVQTRDGVVAMLGRDLKDVLTALSLKLGQLAGQVEKDPAASQLTGEVRALCRVVGLWVNDLVDLAGIDTGAFALAYARCDAAELIHSALSAFWPLARRKRIQVLVQATKGAALLDCDRTRMLQVLATMLHNAFKFTPVGGTVTVGTRTAGRHVEFWVSDDGDPLSERERIGLFDRYPIATAGGRAGLGLFICRQLVEQHQGRIWADPSQGRGATLRFALRSNRPLLEEGEVTRAASAS